MGVGQEGASRLTEDWLGLLSSEKPIPEASRTSWIIACISVGGIGKDSLYFNYSALITMKRLVHKEGTELAQCCKNLAKSSREVVLTKQHLVDWFSLIWSFMIHWVTEQNISICSFSQQ